MPAKVMWLIKGLGLGGAEKLLALAAPYLDRSRFEYEAVYLLPWKTALVAELERLGIPTTCLAHTNTYDPRIIPRLASLLRTRRVDLLHLHLPYTGVIGRLAARLAGTRCVVYTEHNVQEQYHPLSRFANQLTIRLCDRVIAVSDEVLKSLIQSPLARGAKAVAIRNGVDVSGLRNEAAQRPDVRTELSIPQDRLVVGTVSVFRFHKRLDIWLEAARLISKAEPRTVFVVVGDGPLHAEIRHLANRMDLDGQIVFPGLRHDAPRLIAGFDVFMLSSSLEGLPVAVLEAMALARPVVATRVGGLPGVIEDGHHGFLVVPGDPTPLAERVLELLRQPDLRLQFGEAARLRVAEKYGVAQMVRAIETIYSELLASAA